MKYILAYWIVGCVLWGLAIGWHKSRCPNDKISAAEVIVSVATWPRDIAQSFFETNTDAVCGSPAI